MIRADPTPGGLAPVVAAAVAAALVGAAMVATRYVIDQTAPATLALYRYAIGACFLVPAAFVQGRLGIARRDLVPIAALGIAQFGILIALLNYGLQSVPASRASVLFAAMPLLTVLVAASLGAERLGVAKLAGAALTIAGVGLALLDRAAGEHDGVGFAAGDWLGDAAVLASALTGAVCAVLYRPYLRRYPVLPVSAVAMLASVGFLAMLAAGEGFYTAPPRFTGLGWCAVGFIGTASGVGYWLWLWALGRSSPTRVTSWLSMSPIAASALGAALLDEPLGASFLAGVACVAVGIRLAHREAPQPSS